jgi:hypothetical protein
MGKRAGLLADASGKQLVAGSGLCGFPDETPESIQNGAHRWLRHPAINHALGTWHEECAQQIVAVVRLGAACSQKSRSTNERMIL